MYWGPARAKRGPLELLNKLALRGDLGAQGPSSCCLTELPLEDLVLISALILAFCSPRLQQAPHRRLRPSPTTLRSFLFLPLLLCCLLLSPTSAGFSVHGVGITLQCLDAGCSSWHPLPSLVLSPVPDLRLTPSESRLSFSLHSFTSVITHSNFIRG